MARMMNVPGVIDSVAATPLALRAPSAGLTIVVCALILSPVLTYRMGLDQGVFAYIGAELLKGRWPYLFTWDHAFPGAMVWHATEILVFGKAVVMFRLADLLYQLANIFLIYRISERVSDRVAGYLGAATYALIYQGYGPWNTAQREGFGLFWVLLAFWLYLIAERRRANLSALAIGLCLGIAAIFKPTVLALTVMFAPLLGHLSRESWRRALTLVVLALAALIAPSAVIVFFYWTQGGVQQLYEATIAFQAQVYLHRLRGDEPFWLHSLSKVGRLGGHAVGLAIAYVPFLFFGSRRRERLMLFLGYLGSLYAVFVQGTFGGYHYLTGLGIGAVLIGSAFSEASRLVLRSGAWRFDRLRGSAPALLAHALVIAALPVYVSTRSLEELTSLRFLEAPRPNVFRNSTVFDYTESYQLAEFFKMRTTPSEPVQVWGHESLVYYLAEREAASRFQTTTGLVMRVPGQPITPMQRRWRLEFMRDLAQRPPRYLAVVREDHWWWAPEERTSEQLLDDFVEFKRFIQERYVLEGEIGRFLLYRRAEARIPEAR